MSFSFTQDRRTKLYIMRGGKPCRRVLRQEIIISKNVQEAMSICILQSGLFYDWLWPSVFASIVAPNPRVNFSFYGRFQQHKTTLYRWLAKDPIPQTSRNYSQLFLKHASKYPNLRHVSLTVVQANNTHHRPSRTFLGRRSNYRNDFLQFSHVLRLSEMIRSQRRQFTHILRLREDMLWYGPFDFAAYNRQYGNRLIFRPCMKFWGTNDQMWIGPTDIVFDFHRIIGQLFESFRWYNTEVLVQEAARQFQYSEPPAVFVDNRVSAFGLTASPGGWNNEDMCFIASYYKGGCSSMKGGCMENVIRPHPFCSTRTRRFGECVNITDRKSVQWATKNTKRRGAGGRPVPTSSGAQSVSTS